MKQSDVRHVQKHCANYNTGYICSGAMINSHLGQWIDEELYNKPCLIREGKECEYFNQLVKPILK